MTGRGVRNDMTGFKRLYLLLIFLLGIFTATAPCQTTGDYSHLQTDLQTVLEQLSNDIEGLEALQKKLDESGKNHKNYDEQKNIWISSILALQSISAICEYEHDQLSLFLDLKEKNKQLYSAVRKKSLEASIHQIEIMKEQIRINHSILGTPQSAPEIYNQEKNVIESSVRMMKKSLAILNASGPKD